MKLHSFFIKITMNLIYFIFISFTAVILFCYISGPPELPQTFETNLYTDNGQPFLKSLQHRKHVKLNEMNKDIVKATIAVEDKHFYNHFGFDLKRIVRATFKNIRHLKLKEGASTITQQYARNLYLTHDKTWKRKLKEAIYTIRLEMFYSKDEIIEGYLNTIYYGHGAYGIAQASELYFDKQIDDLSIAEISLLVGIPKGPTYYSPFNDEEKALTRQQYILNVLRNEKIIDVQTYNETKEKKLELNKRDEKNITFAPYFTDYVLAEAMTILNIERNEILNNGYEIYTTLNHDLQIELEKTVNDTLNDETDLEVGALSIDPLTGEIKAMVGGRSYEKSSFNRTINAYRAVGSTFKPIVYYAALENGFTPGTMLKSEPTAFTYDMNNIYKPKNFNNLYAHKPITLAQAIAVSDNIYAVKTNMFLGVKEVIKTAKRFGLTSELPEVPSLALGSASISINEMAKAYGMISNGGKEINNHAIVKIVDRHGKTLYQRKLSHKQVLDEKKTFILSQLLTGMFDPGLNGHVEVTGASISHLTSKSFSGKSGTTETDSWMIGYTPSLVTAIWTGYDDNRQMNNLTEKKYAKEIWANFMTKIKRNLDEEKITVPKGVVSIPFDHETGKIATKHCPSNRLTYFEKGTEPNQICHIHLPTKKAKKEEKEEKDKDPFFKHIFDLFFN